MGLVRPGSSPSHAPATAPSGVRSANPSSGVEAADPGAARLAIATAGPGDEPALLARLAREEDAALREAILLALAALGTAAAAEGLAALLSDPEPLLRNASLECLSAMPEPAAVQAAALGHDPDPDLRIAAATLAGELAEWTGHAPAWLLDRLDCEDDPAVAAAAAEAMARIGDARAAPALRRMRGRFAAEPFVTFAISVALDRLGST